MSIYAHLMPPFRLQCRHIFTDGHRCGSPSLKGENFCYYHHATRRPKPTPKHDPYNEPPNQTAFSLPIPEDHSAIQHSLGQIMNQLATNALDPRRAGLLLYALQIASQNLKSAPQHNSRDIVHDITIDPEVGPLAPENEVPGDQNYREFLLSLEEADRAEDEEDEEDDRDGASENSSAPERNELQQGSSPSPEAPQQAHPYYPYSPINLQASAAAETAPPQPTAGRSSRPAGNRPGTPLSPELQRLCGKSTPGGGPAGAPPHPRCGVIIPPTNNSSRPEARSTLS
jgi:hypothetical protein